jgi:hypothetical protein
MSIDVTDVKNGGDGHRYIQVYRPSFLLRKSLSNEREIRWEGDGKAEKVHDSIWQSREAC